MRKGDKVCVRKAGRLVLETVKGFSGPFVYTDEGNGATHRADDVIPVYWSKAVARYVTVPA